MFSVLNRPGRGFDVGNLDVPVSNSVAVAKGDIVQLVMTAGGNWATCTGAGAGNAASTTASYTDATKLITKTGAFSGISTRFTPITFTGATYTHATRTVTKAAAFAAYTINTSDVFYCVGGTGATVGVHIAATRVSDDAITLATPGLGAGADGQTDIAGTLTSRQGKHRIHVTAGTAITPGVGIVLAKISADAVAVDTDFGSDAADVAFTLLDNSLQQGIFGCALTSAAANAGVVVRVIGPCKAFTRNAADAAIAAGNLYGATGAKDLNSDLTSLGLNAKFVAKAVETGTAAATATRALRTVIMNGLHGWGGTYGGVA